MTSYNPMRRLQRDPELFCRKILGVQLWSKQIDIAYAVRDNKRTAVQSGHNVGKALALDTRIPTPRGVKTVGDLRPGDLVLGSHGCATRVVGVSETYEGLDCYSVRMHGAETIRACAQHEWVVWIRRSGGRKRVTVTTAELADMVERGKSVHVDAGRAPDLSHVKVPIEPYVLGLWLGDGTRGRSRITNADADVWHELEREGHTLSDEAPNSLTRNVYGLITDLRKHGLAEDKHVPECYFSASRKDRLSLLQGLMDSDGTISPGGRATFVSTDRPLARAVSRLASGLGIPNLGVRGYSRVIKGEQSQYYVVTWTHHTPVFRIKRKLARIRDEGDLPWHCGVRRVVSVKPIPSEPVKCIEVDAPDHLYLVGDSYVPTHNSFVTACVCLWFVSCFPRAVVLTTANTLAQVDNVLWKEIRRLHKNALYPIGGTFKPKKSEFEVEYERIVDGKVIKESSKMFGFSPGNSDSVNGHHEDNILIVFDEAQGIHDAQTWDAFSSMMTSGNAHQLAIGNPLYSYGPFRQCFRDDKWATERISCLEHPNYVEKRQVVPGALTYESIEEYRLDPIKGPGSEYWDTRIAGIFPIISGNAYMPEPFILQCEELDLDPDLALPGRWMGVDVSGFGNDKTVVVVIVEGRIKHFEALPRMTIKEQVMAVRMIATDYDVPEQNVNYDPHGGVGGEFTRACELMRFDANPVGLSPDPVGDWGFFFGDAKRAPHLFINRRTELHWILRKVCEEKRVSIPSRVMPMLLRESCELRYGYFENGKVYIEAKKHYVARNNGRSPDYNDALVLSMARCQTPRTGAMSGEKREGGDEWQKPWLKHDEAKEFKSNW